MRRIKALVYLAGILGCLWMAYTTPDQRDVFLAAATAFAVVGLARLID